MQFDDRMQHSSMSQSPAMVTPLPSTHLPLMWESWPMWHLAMMKLSLPIRVPPAEVIPRLIITFSRMVLLSPMKQ